MIALLSVPLIEPGAREVAHKPPVSSELNPKIRQGLLNRLPAFQQLGRIQQLCKGKVSALRLANALPLCPQAVECKTTDKCHYLYGTRVKDLLDSCEQLQKNADAIVRHINTMTPDAQLTPDQFKGHVSKIVKCTLDSLILHKKTRTTNSLLWILQKIKNKFLELFFSSNEQPKERISPLITQAQNLLHPPCQKQLSEEPKIVRARWDELL